MVSAHGHRDNKVIEVEEQLSQDDLQACANYLNAHFAGLTLAAIRAQLLELMSEEKALYDSLLQKVVARRRARVRRAEGEAERLPGRHVEHPRATPSSRTWTACARCSRPSRRRADW